MSRKKKYVYYNIVAMVASGALGADQIGITRHRGDNDTVGTPDEKIYFVVYKENKRKRITTRNENVRRTALLYR